MRAQEEELDIDKSNQERRYSNYRFKKLLLVMLVIIYSHQLFIGYTVYLVVLHLKRKLPLLEFSE